MSQLYVIALIHTRNGSPEFIRVALTLTEGLAIEAARNMVRYQEAELRLDNEHEADFIEHDLSTMTRENWLSYEGFRSPDGDWSVCISVVEMPKLS